MAQNKRLKASLAKSMTSISANLRSGSTDVAALAAQRNGSLSPLMRAYAGYGADVTLGSALPRDPRVLLSQFGPGEPPIPSPVDTATRTGRPTPRITQYPVGYNLPTPPGSSKLIAFSTMRTLVDSYDILRLCLEVRKQEVASLDWEIAPREEQKGQFKKMPGKKAGLFDQFRSERLALTEFWNHPNRLKGQSSIGWRKVLMEEMLVLDALSLYEHPTLGPSGGPLGSDLHSIEILDGSTIKPLVDERGSTPQPPYPAYQQFLYGIPRTDLQAILQEFGDAPETQALVSDPEFQNVLRGFPGPNDSAEVQDFQANQLSYRPYTERTWTMYGFPVVEQIIININLALKRQQWHLAYFTDGDIPEMLIHVPDTWPLDQILRFEQQWHAMLGGDMGWKRRMRAIPGPIAAEQMKDPTVHDMAFDEFLMRITCAGCHVDPTEIGMAPPGQGLGGAGFMEGTANRTFRLTIRPVVQWLKEYQDDVNTRRFKQANLEMRYEELEAEDEELQHKIDSDRVGHGTLSLNEYRARRGEEEYKIEQANEPFIILARDVMQVSKIGEPVATGVIGPDGKPVPGQPPNSSDPNATPPKDGSPKPPEAKGDAPSLHFHLEGTPQEQKKMVEAEFDAFRKYLTREVTKGQTRRRFHSDILPRGLVQEAYRQVSKGAQIKDIFADLKSRYSEGLELTANEIAVEIVERYAAEKAAALS